MVGRQVLVLLTGVRVPVPEQKTKTVPQGAAFVFYLWKVGTRTREGVGKRKFPVAEELEPRGSKAQAKPSSEIVPVPEQTIIVKAIDSRSLKQAKNQWCKIR